jgi:molybdenum ABC transporter molybdate-binding protein
MALATIRIGLGRLALALIAACLAASPALAQPPPLTVFAAASLKNALDDVDTAFTAERHIPVRASYAASSALARQIEQAAPADVFISADADWMDYLARKSLIVAASRRDVLTNHLVLVAPATSTITLAIRPGFPLAAALGDGRLAIAGPEVPAGRYGRASLQALGVWDAVKDHLAPAENVRAALAFVRHRRQDRAKGAHRRDLPRRQPPAHRLPRRPGRRCARSRRAGLPRLPAEPEGGGDLPTLRLHRPAAAALSELRRDRYAACTIGRNCAAVSEAPPTSAPPTSASARISAAFCGFTEPP